MSSWSPPMSIFTEDIKDNSVYQEARFFANNIYSFWHLVDYASRSAQEGEDLTTFHKMARKVVTNFRKQLSQKVNSQFMTHEHHLNSDYVRTIEVMSECRRSLILTSRFLFKIGNMLPVHCVGLAHTLVIYAKRILEQVAHIIDT